MMPDITICQNEDCPLSWICWRFGSPPKTYLQSYAEFKFELTEEGGAVCDYFMEYPTTNQREIEIMENEFVPFELSVKLKELGFDEGCFVVYMENGRFQFGNSQYISAEELGKWTKAPLWQQAFDWFREKHRIDVTIHNTYSFDENPTYIAYVGRELIKDPEFISLHSMGLGHKIFINYNEARQACLEKLIEITKEKVTI